MDRGIIKLRNLIRVSVFVFLAIVALVRTYPVEQRQAIIEALETIETETQKEV